MPAEITERSPVRTDWPNGNPHRAATSNSLDCLSTDPGQHLSARKSPAVAIGVVAFQMFPTLQPAAFVMPGATSGFFKLDNIFDQFDPAFQAVHHKVEFPNNVTLFVHTSVPEATLKTRSPEFFKTYSEPRADELKRASFSFWTTALLAAVLPSLGILLLGSLVGWIFNGFARDADA